MDDGNDFGREISETVRSAVDSLPKDIGRTVRDAMGEFFEEGTSAEPDAEMMDKTFEVGSNGELSVTNVSGSIAITGTDSTVITVHATKRGSRRRIENTRIEIEHVGNRVSLKTRGDHAGPIGVRGNVCSVDYDIQVPRACAIQAEGVSADISVRHIRGDISIKAVSGDIDIAQISGECSVTTVSGDITANALEGELRLRTTSGDATIRASLVPRFNLNTVSGDLSIDTPLTPGEHYLAKTVSGDLRIAVPAGTGATVQMKSVSGDVASDLPAEIIKSSRRSWQGRINGGGANVEMHSVSGDLRITLSSSQAAPTATTPLEARTEPQRSDFPDLAPRMPSPPASPTSADTAPPTAAILQQLAQGEISVEDAMAQLEAVDR
jgi:DUF4097 and DUF4098 domain-containing protein YvlB